MQDADLAFAESDEPNPGELQALEQRGDILLIAGEAIERLGDDDVEVCLPRRPQASPDIPAEVWSRR